MKTDRRLRWASILPVVLSGLLFAVASILGLLRGREGMVVVGLLVVSAIWLSLKAGAAPLANGFVGGLLAGVVAVWTQAMFLPTYFLNNPGYSTIEIPFGMDAQTATFVLGPINALVYGVLLAVSTFAFSKLSRPFAQA